ncbi:uncharacterized protein ARB_06610 [Trichophyton benhamiae CBS 112371]|uniref:Uncharacterized protein n=1 Tax=Arthroderma benhamiae (strain ATCC MYA-4681 / CBS 112371) TaxID=663331 RepID=D4AQV0_ARTBC|nr:uncharacterized protein ARB_06610 [Trichophyton benhamiae CBS 112371]EFE34844.1 hypothetical protein ARB_06610 [Trichophyton benhamiae CBS 112371]
MDAVECLLFSSTFVFFLFSSSSLLLRAPRVRLYSSGALIFESLLADHAWHLYIEYCELWTASQKEIDRMHLLRTGTGTGHQIRAPGGSEREVTSPSPQRLSRYLSHTGGEYFITSGYIKSQ